MTNREYLDSLGNKEYSEFLFSVSNCNYYSYVDVPKWLNSEKGTELYEAAGTEGVLLNTNKPVRILDKTVLCGENYTRILEEDNLGGVKLLAVPSAIVREK